MKLTPKQAAFVDAYIETGNASEAARRAGYSKGSIEDASDWLNTRKSPKYKPYLDDAIKARQAEIRSKRTADVTEVMEFLTSVMRGEITEQVITTESVAVGISKVKLVDKPPTISDRTKAADQLLKRFGKPTKLEEKEMQLRIEKLKAEAEALKAVKESGGIQSVGMLQLVDSLNRAHSEREDREDED
jgi:phage terminase small subunit